MGLDLPICQSVCCDPSALDSLALSQRLGLVLAEYSPAEVFEVASRILVVLALGIYPSSTEPGALHIQLHSRCP